MGSEHDSGWKLETDGRMFRSVGGFTATVWDDGFFRLCGYAGGVAPARVAADRVLALVRDNVPPGDAPADHDADPALVSDLRTAAATLRAAGLTPDGAACVALVEAVRRVRMEAPASVPAFGAACVQAAEVSEAERWPRWVGRFLCMTADDTPKTRKYVAHAAQVDGGALWTIYESRMSANIVQMGIEYGDNAIEVAKDSAEAALRAHGLLAPNVRVWR